MKSNQPPADFTQTRAWRIKTKLQYTGWLQYIPNKSLNTDAPPFDEYGQTYEVCR